MEPEKTLNSQRDLEKENQSWRHHNPGLQAVLQKAVIIKTVCTGTKANMFINGTEQRIQKRTHKCMANSSSTKQERISNGKKTVSSTNGDGKIGQ